jgi:hypothetical protein
MQQAEFSLPQLSSTIEALFENHRAPDVGADDVRTEGNTSNAYRVTTNEALFLRCLLQCQNDYGIKPPAELGLPRSIGLVVDYDYVKRLMFTKMLRDDSPAGRRLCREQTYLALKAARTRLMEAGIVGSDDPFVWWTGKPTCGVKETIKSRQIVAPLQLEARL